ncbi:YbhB/YbcL family Raf kinase inhibitor-like protein [Chloroflexia bacterium SDU3-3]|nr:YbhB/YbcL family Raf kinase inhibitor-like protein [Chloroflexia bacterium SDU3-3]
MEQFTLTSTAFADGDSIPSEHTCDGMDQSPPLAWAGAPDGTQSFVLIMDDPDAPSGSFTHWVLFDIPATATALDGAQPAVGVAAINSYQEPGYRGPCPPHGDHAHVYQFTLYALDVPLLALSQRATRREVDGAMDGHIIGRAQLRGSYARHERQAEA